MVIPGSADSHCHVFHMARKGLDVSVILAECREGGMEAIVDVGVIPSDLEPRRELLHEMPWISLTSGIHPSEVGSHSASSRNKLTDLLRRQAAEGGIVAVGEIGLDYHWDSCPRDMARQVMADQIGIAAEFGLPVIIHNRDADADILAILETHRPAGVMHCFSGDADFCRACVELGLYISFAGNVTFKRNNHLREALAVVPDDRLLLETDAPYLSPEPMRGRPNHPGHLGFTIEAVARYRGSSAASLATLTAGNARRLFGLPSSREISTCQREG